jgi:hypothetical protein
VAALSNVGNKQTLGRSNTVTASSRPTGLPYPASSAPASSVLAGPVELPPVLPPASGPSSSALPPPVPPQPVNVGQPLWPVLHLLPLNDTFIPKQIYLSPPGSRLKIGRQTNAKTVPAATNGYFDSKVLSRTHAEVWFEPYPPTDVGETPPGGRVFIKDVGSSNGTFINGERLSVESVKSDVFELHSEDTVEFGIDIASEDNRTILHHKVASKVHLALTQEEAQSMTRQLSAFHQKMNSEVSMRRMSRAGVASSGLSFDHVLSRLQVRSPSVLALP